MQKKSEIQSDVTSRIIQALESDLLPWRRPWQCDPNSGLCSSLSTGKLYQGINQLLLQLASLNEEYESKWWGTYQQIKSAGACVKKGENGTRIVLYKPVSSSSKAENGEEAEEQYCLMRSFVVFNVEQTNGLDEHRVGKAPTHQDRFPQHQQAEQLIQATGCTILYQGNRAYYSLTTDEVSLPPRGQFESPEAFYETAFHELSHWAESRTGFGQSNPQNTYAFAELVAEISACLLMAELRLETKQTIQNSAAYLDHWLTALHQDKTFIFKAASQAQKAFEYLLSFLPSELVSENL